MDFILVVTSLTFLALALFWIRQLLGAKSSLPLPPSPKGIPVIGNLLDLAGDEVHVTCRDWSRQFGMLPLSGSFSLHSPVYAGDDTISLNILGNTMVVLNSAKAISDIFDKRGSNYSDRPDMPMIVDLYAITYVHVPFSRFSYLCRMGWDWTFALMRYGPRWKEHRRVFHSHFNHSVVEHQEIQLEISRELLTLLLKSPEKYAEHMRQYA